ncbi:MAG TPA: cytochrome c oxidase subunit 4 [Ilumatobacter sp.]|nr:cytochrome c oxidase subunit 4 [Ilumatobacter sp.]
MKLSRLIWIGGAVHFAFFTVVYAIVADDAAGLTLFAAGIAFAGLVAAATWVWWRRHGDLASDRADADASEESGPVGVFAAASLRPLALGAGMTGIVLGVVIGVWMTLVGLAIVASQVALLVRDTDS